MRMPRVRFTVRRMMVMVAVLGLIFAAEVTRRRSQGHWLMVNYHANEERRMRLVLGGGWITETDEAGTRKKLRIGPDLEHEQVQRRLMYHVLMGDRYRRAARRPWLSPAPDPLEPE